MAIGSWNPDAKPDDQQFQVERANLETYIALSSEGRLNELPTIMSADQQQLQAATMHLSKDQWFAAADMFNDKEIEHLMRFFTVAETLPGWDAGADSPVIWLGKLLKQRGVGINRELTLWIKANSNNQFLPHGAL